MKNLPAPEVISSPFAELGDKADNFPKSSPDQDTINYQYGIPAGFCVPNGAGGIKFTRQMMNRLGFMATQFGFLFQCGIPVTFSKDVSDEIGGYPKGAILKYIKITNGYRLVADVISLVDDNKYDFTEDGVDGENWAFVDEVQDNFYPNLSIGDNNKIQTYDVKSSGDVGQFVVPKTGWIYVKVARVNDFESAIENNELDANSMFLSAIMLSFSSEYGGVGRSDSSDAASTYKVKKDIPMLALPENGMMFPVVEGGGVSISAIDPAGESLTVSVYMLGTSSNNVSKNG